MSSSKEETHFAGSSRHGQPLPPLPLAFRPPPPRPPRLGRWGRGTAQVAWLGTTLPSIEAWLNKKHLRRLTKMVVMLPPVGAWLGTTLPSVEAWLEYSLDAQALPPPTMRAAARQIPRTLRRSKKARHLFGNFSLPRVRPAAVIVFAPIRRGKRHLGWKTKVF